MDKNLRLKIIKRTLHLVGDNGIVRTKYVELFGLRVAETNKTLTIEYNGIYKELTDDTWGLLIFAVNDVIATAISRCHDINKQTVLDYIDNVDKKTSYVLVSELYPDAVMKGSSVFINSLHAKYGAFSLTNSEEQDLAQRLRLLVASDNR